MAPVRHLQARQCLTLARDLGKAARPVRVRQNLAQALHAVGDVRVHEAGLRAQAVADAVGLATDQVRTEPHGDQERHKHEGKDPRVRRQDREGKAGHEDGDECRGDCVGEETLDRLDVAGHHARQVAGATPQEIGRGKAFQAPKEGNPHLAEEAVGHVVADPTFIPRQAGGYDGNDGHANGEGCDRVGHARHTGRPGEDARGHAECNRSRCPEDAGSQGDGQPHPLRAHELQEAPPGLDRTGIVIISLGNRRHAHLGYGRHPFGFGGRLDRSGIGGNEVRGVFDGIRDLLRGDEAREGPIALAQVGGGTGFDDLATV